jgi:excisionase family DNA binding protein
MMFFGYLSLEEYAVGPIILDCDELAGRLDVHPKTVERWARAGKIPSIQDERGKVLFNLRSVMTTLREKPAPQKEIMR